MRLCPVSPESELASAARHKEAALWGPGAWQQQYGAGAQGPRHHPLSLSASTLSCSFTREKHGQRRLVQFSCGDCWQCWPGGSCSQSWNGLSSKGTVNLQSRAALMLSKMCSVCAYIYTHMCTQCTQCLPERPPRQVTQTWHTTRFSPGPHFSFHQLGWNKNSEPPQYWTTIP